MRLSRSMRCLLLCLSWLTSFSASATAVAHGIAHSQEAPQSLAHTAALALGTDTRSVVQLADLADAVADHNVLHRRAPAPQLERALIIIAVVHRVLLDVPVVGRAPTMPALGDDVFPASPPVARATQPRAPPLG